MRKPLSLAIVLIALFQVLVVYQNCTEARLRPLDPETIAVSSQGSFRTSRPDDEVRYTKFLFVVDKSSSNRDRTDGTPPVFYPGTDTTGRRATAIENFFLARRNDPYIRWGFIQFGQSRAEPSSAYITDSSGRPAFATGTSGQVEAALSRHRATPDNGCTPYRSAFSLVRETIQADYSRDPTESANSRYMIFFMSDGGPTDYKPLPPGSNPDSCFAEAPGQPAFDDVTSTVNLTPPGPGRIFLSTAYYGPDNAANREGLRQMAEVYGGGRFVDVSDISARINLDDLISGGVTMDPFTIKNFVVYNMSASLCEDGRIEVDSDGDGVCDRDETRMGLNPTKRFSISGSPYGDFFHFRRIKYGEILPACLDSSGRADPDFDLLTNCEEKYMKNVSPNPSTLPLYPEVLNPDTDQDGFLDGIESMMFRLLTSPTNMLDVLTDFDNEGQAAKQIRQHRDPRQADPFNYTYDVRIQPISTDPLTGRTTYSFSMNELQLFQTQTTPVDGNMPGMSHNAGENIVYVHYIQIKQNDPNDKGRLMKSFQKIRSGGPGLIINDEIFTPYDIPDSP